MASDSSEEDWDAAFTGEIGKPTLKLPPSTNNQIKITGVVAKPTDEVEDWDSDFDDLEESKLKKAEETTKVQSVPAMLPQRLLTRRTTTRGSLGSSAMRSPNDNESRLLAVLKTYSLQIPDLETIALERPEQVKEEPLSEVVYKETKISLVKKLSLVEEGDDKLLICRLHFEQGLLDQKQGFHGEAMKHFQTSIELLTSQSISNQVRELKANIRLHMGITAKALQDLLKAIFVLKDALNHVDPISNRDLSANINYELGVCYEEMNERVKSVEAFNSFTASILQNWTKDKKSTSSWSNKTCVRMAYSFFAISQFILTHKEKDYDLAYTFLCKALQLARLRNDELYHRIEQLIGEVKLNITTTASGKEAAKVQKDTIEEEESFEDWDAEFTVKASPIKIDQSSKRNSGYKQTKKEINSIGSSTALNTSGDSIRVSSSSSGKTQSPRVVGQGIGGGGGGGSGVGGETASEEDWDAEFSIPKQDAPKIGTLFLSEPAKISVSQYPLIQSKSFKTVKYPPPSLLYSLKTKENHKLMNETQLETWLSTFSSKHKQALSNLNEKKKSTQSGLANSSVGSAKWLTAYLTFWQKQFFTKELPMDYVWDSLVTIFEQLSSVKKEKKEKHKKQVLNELLIEALNFACQTVKLPEKREQFKKVLQVVREYDSKLKPYVKLIEASTLSHNKIQNPLKVYFQIFEEVKTELSLDKLSEKDHLTQGEFSPLSVCARALASAQLYLSGRSPLTGNPLTGLDSSDPNMDDEDNSEVHHLVSDDEERQTFMSLLYPYMSLSFAKSIVSFAMSINQVDAGDADLAEKLSFESVYILDNISMYSGVPALVSRLGCSMLFQYSELLYTNSKYKYSILAYEATLSMMGVLDSSQYYTLLRHVAKLAHGQHDIKTAIDMYSEILEDYLNSHYNEQHKTNEIVYVSEILSGMYVEIGNFAAGERVLHSAISLFPDHEIVRPLSGVSKKKSLDPNFLKLQMLLANHYLSSFSFERGLKLLEGLMSTQPPIENQKYIIEKLIMAYIKKRWFKEGNALLGSLKEIIDKDVSSTTKEYVTLWRLASLNFYHAARYVEAINCVDKAIMLTESESYSMLAQLYYLRGRILHSICRSPNKFTFPASITLDKNLRNSSEISYLFENVEPLKYPTFQTAGDFLQECAATYKQASNFGDRIGDELCLAKTLAATAELYLDFTFPLVAFFEMDWSDICSLPYFISSSISMNTREAERQKKEQQKAEVQRKKNEKRNKRYQRVKSAGSNPGKVMKKSKGGVIERELIYTTKSTESIDLAVASKKPLAEAGKQKSGILGKFQKPSSGSISKNIDSDDDDIEIEASTIDDHINPTEVKEFEMKLDDILNWTELALDVSTSTSNIFLQLQGYLNMCELQYLLGDQKLALSFWIEFRDIYVDFFSNGNQILFAGAPPGMLFKIYKLLSRAVRFLLSMEKDVINENLRIIDIFLQLEIEVEKSIKRPIGQGFNVYNDRLGITNPERTKVSPKKKFSTTHVESKRFLNHNEYLEEQELTLQEKNSSVLWGYYYYLKQLTHKYVEGKVDITEMGKITQKCLRKILQVSERIRSGPIDLVASLASHEQLQRGKMRSRRTHAKLSSQASTGNRPKSDQLNLSVVNRGNDDKQLFWSSDSNRPRTNSNQLYHQDTHKESVQNQILYILHIGENIYYFSPRTGNVRVQRLGVQVVQFSTVKKPKQFFYVVVQLAKDQVMLMVSPSTTLEHITRFLVDEKNWSYHPSSAASSLASPSSSSSSHKRTMTPTSKATSFYDSYGITRFSDRKGGFFGKFGASKYEAHEMGESAAVISEISKTPLFYVNFKKLLLSSSASINVTNEMETTTATTTTTTTTTTNKSNMNSNLSQSDIKVAESISDSSDWDEDFDDVKVTVKASIGKSGGDDKHDKSMATTTSLPLAASHTPSNKTSIVIPPSTSLPTIKLNQPQNGSQTSRKSRELASDLNIAQLLNCVMLAKHRDDDSSFNTTSQLVPLKNRMKKKIYEVFNQKMILSNSKENPFKLQLYISVETRNKKSKSNSPIIFNESTVRCLSELVLSPDDKSTDLVIPVSDFQQSFSVLPEVWNVSDKLGESTNTLSNHSLRSSEVSSTSGTSSTSSSTNSMAFSSSSWGQLISHANNETSHDKCFNPLYIISSSSLRVFPWELILNHATVIRSFTFYDILYKSHLKVCNTTIIIVIVIVVVVVVVVVPVVVV
eukprot:TRINITY_DN6409_c1_g1_i1.p1 TRINITY_DN6409_c1_g1~~TRINITY_DN6409_c1_g1_i1.p1  ORF type:complete len:2206 (-),score=614.56 TRINITY_DN6409_c1_g1_i1:857-7474(-)